MAKQSRSARSSNGAGNSSASSRRDGKRSSSKKRSKRDFEDYSIADPAQAGDGPDVLLDVPVLKVDEVEVDVEDLRAQVAVMAEVSDLVKLSMGADARLGKVQLKIAGVEAQALLKARLDKVSAILERVFLTLDRNPKLLESVGRAVEDVGGGAGHTVAEAGEAAEHVGEGAQGAVQDVGEGAGQAAGQVGEGAGQAVGELGQGAGQGVADVGQGAKQLTGQAAAGK
jgi:hypothetical protein